MIFFSVVTVKPQLEETVEVYGDMQHIMSCCMTIIHNISEISLKYLYLIRIYLALENTN